MSTQHTMPFGAELVPEGWVRFRRLDYLAELGVTTVELIPAADFPGRRNGGYDGVLLFAPDAAYGRPEDLKRLVDAAHARRLMVFLDIAYNPFGPEGNYLHCYASRFFSEPLPHRRLCLAGGAFSPCGAACRANQG